ncbi:YrhB domain-containing protein [Streptomyces polyrhachis]|uniref:YrhB domain-containing protein n=1 Tax=Streptomyces polyrhachis TaxID=1282885 RepID=A0ABW2GIJ8_9ACTN
MIERETAMRMVEEELDHTYRSAYPGPDRIRTTVVAAEEHELVWIVRYQSEEYLRTRNPSTMLIGNGPYLVDRVDGGLHRIGVLSARGGEWEADYRVRIRGERIRTPLDDLHDELHEAVALHGRPHSVRTLRQKLPALSPAEALAYVKGLQAGAVAPRLLAVAVDQLVEPVDPVFGVETIRPASGG